LKDCVSCVAQVAQIAQKLTESGHSAFPVVEPGPMGGVFKGDAEGTLKEDCSTLLRFPFHLQGESSFGHWSACCFAFVTARRDPADPRDVHPGEGGAVPGDVGRGARQLHRPPGLLRAG
jgi:hypothetical protein